VDLENRDPWRRSCQLAAVLFTMHVGELTGIVKRYDDASNGLLRGSVWLGSPLPLSIEDGIGV